MSASASDKTGARLAGRSVFAMVITLLGAFMAADATLGVLHLRRLLIGAAMLAYGATLFMEPRWPVAVLRMRWAASVLAVGSMVAWALE